MPEKPRIEVRQSVTLAYSGSEPLVLKAQGMKASFTLLPGKDNEVPIGLFHAAGGNADIAELLAAGIIQPVCRNHKFETLDAEDAAKYSAQSGQRLAAGDDHPELIHCRYCGHTRETAAGKVIDHGAVARRMLAEAKGKIKAPEPDDAA